MPLYFRQSQLMQNCNNILLCRMHNAANPATLSTQVPALLKEAKYETPLTFT